ncbi:MAG: GtrA family protein, partial [Planctomycetaceae bacterium]
AVGGILPSPPIPKRIAPVDCRWPPVDRGCSKRERGAPKSPLLDFGQPTRLSTSKRTASDLLKSSWRFLFVSGFSFCLTFGITLFVREVLGQSEQRAFGSAITSALVINFLFLRYFIYGRSRAPLLPQLGIYLVSASVFRLGEFLLFEACLRLIELDYRVSTIVVLASSTVLKFLYYRIVFRR